jgi:hypothetical protein
MDLEGRARRMNQASEARGMPEARSHADEDVWCRLRTRQARRALAEFVSFTQRHGVPLMDLYLASPPRMIALLAPKNARKPARITSVFQIWKIDERLHAIRNDVVTAVAVTPDLRVFRCLILSPAPRRGRLTFIDNVYARTIPPFGMDSALVDLSGVDKVQRKIGQLDYFNKVDDYEIDLALAPDSPLDRPQSLKRPPGKQKEESFVAGRCWLDDLAETAAARVLNGTYVAPVLDSTNRSDLYLPPPIGYRRSQE